MKRKTQACVSQAEKQSVSPKLCHYFKWSERSEPTVLLWTWRVVTHWKGWKLLSSLCTCRSFHQFVLAGTNCRDWINNLSCHISSDFISAWRAFQALCFIHFVLHAKRYCIMRLDSLTMTTCIISVFASVMETLTSDLRFTRLSSFNLKRKESLILGISVELLCCLSTEYFGNSNQKLSAWKKRKRKKKENDLKMIKSNIAFSIQDIDSMNQRRFHTFTTHLCDDLGSADYIIIHRAFCEFLWRKILQPLGLELQQFVDVVSCHCYCKLLNHKMAVPAVQYWAPRVAVSLIVSILGKKEANRRRRTAGTLRRLEYSN